MKDRADLVLVREGYVDTIKIAQSYIMQKLVLLDDRPIEKPGQEIEYGSKLRIKGKDHPYVSRGGLKIERAIEFFNIPVTGSSCLDIGASTGGFTDCLLKNGALKVFAVDVGYGQLAWSLQSDPRVIIMDRTNIRNVELEDLGERLDLITADVSFISLKIVLPTIDKLLKETGSGLILIKPQFEAKKEEVGPGGVIRDKQVHIRVLQELIDQIGENNFYVKNLTYSPITGASGNIEFLAQIVKSGESLEDFKLETIVEQAHEKFGI